MYIGLSPEKELKLTISRPDLFPQFKDWNQIALVFPGVVTDGRAAPGVPGPRVGSSPIVPSPITS